MSTALRTRRPPKLTPGERVVEWVTGAERATFSMSALRILFGIAMLWFLVASAADRHYLWGAGSVWVDPAVDRRGYPEILRIVFPKDDPVAFDFSYGILIALAMLFIAGLATRIVTPVLLLFWVALATNSVFLTNGGDVVIRIALLFCVFADLSRHWSLDEWWRRRAGLTSIYPRALTRRIPAWLKATAHNTAVVLCGYQVVLIYVNSGIFKLMGQEWLEGSALYYAFQLDVFRVFPVLSDLAWRVTPFVVVGSWISIWAQLLFPVLLLWRPTRYVALMIIMGMHLGIGLFLGLWPFSIAMIALDLVFVRDASWKRALAWAGRSWRAVRTRLSDAAVDRSVKPRVKVRSVVLNGVHTHSTPSSEEHPMVQIIETIDVDVPVGTAYNQWTQFESFPKFLDEVESITQLDATHTHWKVKVGPVEREFDAEITEQHPDERVAWTSTGGDTHHAGVVTFHKLTDSSSRVTVQLDWEPEGLIEKVGSLVGAGSHAVKKDLKNFKQFIEGQGVATGAWRGEVQA